MTWHFSIALVCHLIRGQWLTLWHACLTNTTQRACWCKWPRKSSFGGWSSKERMRRRGRNRRCRWASAIARWNTLRWDSLFMLYIRTLEEICNECLGVFYTQNLPRSLKSHDNPLQANATRFGTTHCVGASEAQTTIAVNFATEMNQSI